MNAVAITQDEQVFFIKWMSQFMAKIQPGISLSLTNIEAMDHFLAMVPRMMQINNVDKIYLQSLRAKIEAAYGTTPILSEILPPINENSAIQ